MPSFWQPLHHVSPKGRASSSNVQADGFWRVSIRAVSAMSSGLTKKLSSLSASFVRIDGSSTIPSMMISETWIFDGPSERARDSARLR